MKNKCLVRFLLDTPTHISYRNITLPADPRNPSESPGSGSHRRGARCVRNRVLADHHDLYQMARMFGGKVFTELRRCTPSLRETVYVPVRYTLKHQADAWRRYFRGQGGRPQFKVRRSDDSITIPQEPQIRADKPHFPRTGPMQQRRRGGNPYPHGWASGTRRPATQ